MRESERKIAWYGWFSAFAPLISPYLMVCLLPFFTTAYAQDCVKTEEKLALLQNTPSVESRFIGYAGHPSIIFQAFLDMGKCENAAFLYDRLYETSKSNAGKVYSLMWFYRHKREEYEKRKSSMNRSDKVNITIGCVHGTDDLDTVFKGIENGEWTENVEMELAE
jgi:hypothetical protein